MCKEPCLVSVEKVKDLLLRIQAGDWKAGRELGDISGDCGSYACFQKMLFEAGVPIARSAGVPVYAAGEP